RQAPSHSSCHRSYGSDGRRLQLRAEGRPNLGGRIRPSVGDLSSAAPRDIFQLGATDGAARAGILHTSHGDVETPVFMPVGTYGAVRTVSPDEVAGLGARLILGNTYHLLLRPGPELIERLGGLHRFMSWPGAILTDSGGFQVFSLAKFRRVGDEAVSFRSHLDGSEIVLTPERAIDIQQALGSD